MSMYHYLVNIYKIDYNCEKINILLKVCYSVTTMTSCPDANHGGAHISNFQQVFFCYLRFNFFQNKLNLL